MCTHVSRVGVLKFSFGCCCSMLLTFDVSFVDFFTLRDKMCFSYGGSVAAFWERADYLVYHVNRVLSLTIFNFSY